MSGLISKISHCFLAICFSIAGSVGATAYAQEAIADGDAAISRGGRLYENWMIELDERAPESVHPGYTGKNDEEGAIANSWRCVSCHGWDYRGVNGQGDLWQTFGKSIDNIVAILKDSNHQYGEYLEAKDLQDIALFVSRGLVKMQDMVDSQTFRAKGETLVEKPFFDTVCAMCHGADGQSLPGVSLGAFANQSPYLTLHSIFNGHPGAVMPSLRAFEEKKLVNLFAYMQTLPEEPSLVSIVRGGRLYDNWAMETGRDVPRGIHPAYPRNLKPEGTAKKTWMCVECHGWDYRGKDGSFSQGKHFTGIKGIAGMKGVEAKKIIRLLKDDNHDYGGVLSAQDLLDLANFVSNGQLDMDEYIQRDNKKAKGDASAHKIYYPTLCGNCHGPQGREIRTMGALGRVANDDPWKALHKILNGHPAEEMPAWRSLEKETILDLLDYIQGLPVNKRS